MTCVVLLARNMAAVGGCLLAGDGLILFLCLVFTSVLLYISLAEISLSMIDTHSFSPSSFPTDSPISLGNLPSTTEVTTLLYDASSFPWPVL